MLGYLSYYPFPPPNLLQIKINGFKFLSVGAFYLNKEETILQKIRNLISNFEILYVYNDTTDKSFSKVMCFYV